MNVEDGLYNSKAKIIKLRRLAKLNSIFDFKINSSRLRIS